MQSNASKKQKANKKYEVSAMQSPSKIHNFVIGSEKEREEEKEEHSIFLEKEGPNFSFRKEKKHEKQRSHKEFACKKKTIKPNQTDNKLA